jgi:hypothetical protein
VLVPLLRLVGRAEELHLHLLELAGAEDEVAGGDLVPERLADLGDTERRLLAGELEDVLEVVEDPLRRLGPQIGVRARVGDRSDLRLDQQVEVARLPEIAVRAFAWVLGGLVSAFAELELVLAEALLADLALDQRVGEAGEVS